MRLAPGLTLGRAITGGGDPLAGIASIVGWWHEADVVQASGTPVASWPNRVEGGAPLTQAIGTQRLTRRDAYLESDGVDDVCDAEVAFSSSDERHIFIRVRPLTPPGTNGNENSLAALFDVNTGTFLCTQYYTSNLTQALFAYPGPVAASATASYQLDQDAIYEFYQTASSAGIRSLLHAIAQATASSAMMASTRILVGSITYNPGHNGFHEIIVMKNGTEAELALVRSALTGDKLLAIPGLDVWRANRWTWQEDTRVVAAGEGNPVRVWGSNMGRALTIFDDTWRPSITSGFIAMDNADDMLRIEQARPDAFTLIVRIKLTGLGVQKRFLYANYTAIGIDGGVGNRITLLNEGIMWDYAPTGPVETIGSEITLRMVRESPTLVKLYRNGVLISQANVAQAADSHADLRFQLQSYKAIAYARRVLTDDECAMIESEFANL